MLLLMPTNKTYISPVNTHTQTHICAFRHGIHGFTQIPWCLLGGWSEHCRPRGRILAPYVSQTIKLTNHSSERLMFVIGSRAVVGDCVINDALLFLDHTRLTYIDSVLNDEALAGGRLLLCWNVREHFCRQWEVNILVAGFVWSHLLSGRRGC